MDADLSVFGALVIMNYEKIVRSVAKIRIMSAHALRFSLRIMMGGLSAASISGGRCLLLV